MLSLSFILIIVSTNLLQSVPSTVDYYSFREFKTGHIYLVDFIEILINFIFNFCGLNEENKMTARFSGDNSSFQL